MAGSIKGSKTEQNLLKAFAGESQARNRYTFFASEARKAGLEQIAAVFEETAMNEKEHAKVFFKHLEGGDLEITATYPAGAIKDTRANLAAAAAGEKAEWGTIYPDFAKVARAEGFPDVASSFEQIARAEAFHEMRYNRLGDIGLIFVAPEQFRSTAFANALMHREVGAWVFDEAHCLSKWGHDFRPDYLYAARFIRELAKQQGGGIPAIAGFTDTAKQDVKAEILEHFRVETGRELTLFEGGVERDNLRFEVRTVGSYEKFERLHDLLSDRLPAKAAGSAIVFRATREAVHPL